MRFNDNEVFISNEVGEFSFVSNKDFDKLVKHKLNINSQVFLDLKAKQVLTDTEIEPVIEMLSVKYRTKKSFLNNFTALHMVVPTIRCNSNCIYCQVSRKDIDAPNCDMDKPTAKKIVDIIFKSPSSVIKIEFQGGEPLLSFKIVRYIIEYAEWLNIFKRKHLEFVICTNLSLMTDKMLRYLKKHKVYVSTSLDGQKDLHNKNRPLQNGDDSHERLIQKINLCRKYLGQDSVSALMTASQYSLNEFKDIVDEYIAQGFHAIFFRSLNPFGFAKRDKEKIGYRISSFVKKYKEAVDYIIELNLNGTYFVEGFASLLLKRILTPFSTGFVDLQSPAGIAISGVIYDYDGNVYVSDEARMLASSGDHKFLMGNVHRKSYQELFNSDFLHSLLKSSCLECLPQCSDCALQSFCGASPVRNYSECGDVIGKRNLSEECYKNREIMQYFLELVRKDDERVNKVFWSWI